MNTSARPPEDHDDGLSSGGVIEGALVKQKRGPDRIEYELPARHKELRSILEPSLPSRPYCTDAPKNGLLIRKRASALKFPHIQFNGPSTFAWMLFDIDRNDAYFAHDDGNLPPPNFIAINRQNGHGHAGILLAAPVHRHSASRQKPLRFFAAVERGLSRRFEADPQYVGLIAKNPLHPVWRTEVWRLEPYTLEELAGWLRDDDMRPPPRVAESFGAGRNVSVFDDLRSIAYREVLAFKGKGASQDAFRARCEGLAVGLNQQFPVPMSASEVKAIAKSVAKWTWRNFNQSDFSLRQCERAHRRWRRHVAAEATKPWEAENISRRTWYRRRAGEKKRSCGRTRYDVGHTNWQPCATPSPFPRASLHRGPRPLRGRAII